MDEQQFHNQHTSNPPQIQKRVPSWKKTLVSSIVAGLGFFVVLPIIALTLYVKILVLLLDNNVVGEILIFPIVGGTLILGYVLFEKFFLRKR